MFFASCWGKGVVHAALVHCALCNVSMHNAQEPRALQVSMHAGRVHYDATRGLVTILNFLKIYSSF